jgi:RimK-like ATP-grasp domain.
LKKKLEIRSFFIEGNFFSMAIFSQSSEQTKIDFRKYNNKLPNRTEPFKLPISIEDKLKKVFESIELNCGSVDLIIDKNDEYFFLEINPVGQYGMVSDPCNYELDKLIAKYLINGEFKIN